MIDFSFTHDLNVHYEDTLYKLLKVAKYQLPITELFPQVNHYNPLDCLFLFQI